MVTGGAVALAAASPGSTGARHSGAAASRTITVHLAAGNTVLSGALAGGQIGGIAAAPDGTIYVGATKSGHSYVAVYDAKRTFLRSWDVDGRDVGSRGLLHLAVGPDGLVYTAPQPGVDADPVVRVFSPAGAPVRTLGAGSFPANVSDIEVDGAGNVYLASSANRAHGIQDDVILRLDPSGAVTGRFVPLPGGPTQVLRGIAVAPDGSVWATANNSAQPVFHFDAGGHPLAVPGFVLAIPNAHADQFQDVELAGGTLYFAGAFGPGHGRVPGGPNIEDALAVVSTGGRLMDSVAGHGTNLAVAPDGDVYVTDLDASTSGGAASAAASDEFGDEQSSSVEVPPTSNTDAFAFCDNGSAYQFPKDALGPVARLPGSGGAGCQVHFDNVNPPHCQRGVPVASGGSLGGQPLPRGDISQPDPVRSVSGGTGLGADVHVPLGSTTASGPVVVQYDCHTVVNLTIGPATGETHFEYKGDLQLEDPSGTVVDAATHKPVGAARVRVQVALRPSGPFGTPSLSALQPQFLTQETSSSGEFGWQVGPGYWRLVVTAFGYRRYVSRVYKVPPPVTGLVLKLRADPRQQRYLIDPRGRVGGLRLKGKLRRAAGLKISALRGRIRSITVRSKRYRTAAGVRLGTTRGELLAGLPQASRQKGFQTATRYRVAHATFTLSRAGKISRIVLR